MLNHKECFAVSVFVSAILIAPQIADAQDNTARDGNNGTLPTPPGLYVTPVAPLNNGFQQLLNPGLANYPNFVAGEAVKVVLSPDSKTLAILTAGQNSMYNTAGSTDRANSTQYIFLYDVQGANKTRPALKQVITQNNSYVGLVWSPDSLRIYAAGGCDDLVYTYTLSPGGSFTPDLPIHLGHDPRNGCFTATVQRRASV